MAKAPADIRSMARAHTDRALRVLIEIAEDRSAPASARVQAASILINRGLGTLIDERKFVLADETFYVYSIHNQEGRLIYIGKGSNRRHFKSAQKFGGKSRIRAEFKDERAALAFERRLIKRFRPPHNVVYISAA